jgi:KipI family sensor histidine kinase inhibitor
VTTGAGTVRQTGGMRSHRLGRDALLVEVADGTEALAVYREARRRGVQALDVVPAARTVLFDGVPDVDRLADAVRSWSLETATTAGDRVEVPTVYDGDDLDDVARLWNMTRDEVVGTHTSTDFEVVFCGFAPGFAYCAGLPESLAVPRLESPRPRVPAGAVALAGRFTGVYPSASPGGWRLLGRTALVLWDVDRDPPATLPPGTRVRFTPA